MLSYDAYPIGELGLDYLRVEAGRGCPFACTFCSTASFFQRSFRLKSPPRILKELDTLRARYGYTDFKLDHDMFTVDRKKVLAFCAEIDGKGYRWRVSARVDCVDQELLETMAAAGCVGLYFGIETGSPRIQQVSKKRLDVGRVEATLDITERLGIQTTVSFITGFPEEIQADQDMTLDMLGRSFRRPARACVPQLHILTPEPGTPLFGERVATLEYDGYGARYNACLLSKADELAVRVHPDIYSTYYYYPGAMPRRSYTFAVDVVDALRIGGGVFLRYLLCHFDGKLSFLVARLREWADHNERHDCAKDLLVRDFLDAEFGPRNHLTALFGYVSSVDSHRERTSRVSASPSDEELCFDADRSYQLGPHAFLVEDVPDCAKLLDRVSDLRQDPMPIVESEVGPRGCYLFVVGDAAVFKYCLDPGLCAILVLFVRPRSVREVLTALAPIADGVVADESVFKQLIRARALVSA